MSNNTINKNNHVFQNMHMAERQSLTNTTNKPNLSIDNTQPFIMNNNISIPPSQVINLPIFQQPLISFPAPPPPAAFQIQPTMNIPNQKLNPSAPTFTPNPFSNIPVQGYNNFQQQINESLAKLQILSIQLNTLQIINQQTPTIESLSQYQHVYQAYNKEFANALLLTQYINNLNNIQINKPVVNNNITKKKQLETIEEGENESEVSEISDSISGVEGTDAGTSYGENPIKNVSTNSINNLAAITATTATAAAGELVPEVDAKKEELEKIKRQIRVILNKITTENFDKLSFEIASLLKVSDISANELINSKISEEELYKLQKSQFKALIKLILKCILEKAINETSFSNLYGRLCYSLYLYAENNQSKKKIFRQQLLSICHSMFTKTRMNNQNHKFIGIITMIGELFKFGLVSWNVIYSGIFEQLLPPLNPIDIQGVCKILKVAGHDFDRHHYKDISNIVRNLSKYAERYDFRTQCFVKDITEMRGNGWDVRQKNNNNKRYNNNNNNRKKYYNNYRNNNGWRNNNNNKYGNYNSYNNRKRSRNIRPTVEFVKDVTLQDRSHFAPNKILTKTWAMRNSGEMSWGDNVELVYFKGDKTLSLDDRYPVINASPGQQVQISATIKTPSTPGRYCTYFRLQKNGKFFGPRVWVDIIVSLNISTNPSPINSTNNYTKNESNNKILSCQ